MRRELSIRPRAWRLTLKARASERAVESRRASANRGDRGFQILFTLARSAYPAHDARSVGSKTGGQCADAEAVGEVFGFIGEHREGQSEREREFDRGVRLFVLVDANEADVGVLLVQTLKRRESLFAGAAILREKLEDNRVTSECFWIEAGAEHRRARSDLRKFLT